MTTPVLITAVVLGFAAIVGVVFVVRVSGSTAGVTATARAIGALLVTVIRALDDHSA
jgi:hypothetical protein